MRSLLLLLPVAAVFAQLPGFQAQGTTATQAVIAYTAPAETRACKVEVSESPRYLPLVADADPRIFPQSNLDLNRTGTVAAQRNRIVVIGRRVAEAGADGRRYSRALQAYTQHYVRVTCDNLVQEATFTTTNIALGQTYNDPLPGDPDRPGEYGWPTIDWNDRTQKIVDPKTGLQLQKLTTSEDEMGIEGPFSFARTRDLSGIWANPGSAIANDNDAASAADPGWLFLESGWSMVSGGTREYNAIGVRTFTVTLNAWCADCGTVDAPGRTIEACLSIDGVTCTSKTLEAVVENCAADCTSARYRFQIGAGGPPVVTAWGIPDQYDQSDFHKRTGTAVRRGRMLWWTGGISKFNLNWKRGSQIDLNGNTYSIQKVNHELLLTLDGDFADDDVEPGNFSGSNFGLMVRRKVSGPGRITLQYAQFFSQVGYTPRWEAGGELESNTSCSPKMTAGPGGEMGWHCSVGTTVYWIGGDTGTVNRLAKPIIPGRAGEDGWSGDGVCNSISGGGPLWDPEDPDSFYCGQQSPANGGTVLVRAKYWGGNADTGPANFYTPLRSCNVARDNQPCFELTNITPPSKGLSLRKQLAKLMPDDWQLVRNTTINIGSIRGSYMVFLASSGNNSFAVLGLVDPATGLVVAAAPSWKKWPLRWAGLHGLETMQDAEWLPAPASFFRGPFTGRDNMPLNGPYVSRITSGAIPATGAPCPARPADSPIPPQEWPAEDRCLEITIDGEPGDPTPFYYDNGAVSSTGNVVTGVAGAAWYPVNGGQLRVEGNWYQFEWTSPTSGTITPTPSTPFQNSKYELYVEPVNNPKTGNPLHAYLADIEPRDVMALTGRPGFSIYTWDNEFVRVLIKQGKRVVVERGLIDWDGSRARMLPVPADGYATMIAASCVFTSGGFCQAAQVMWNAIRDPLGQNASGTTVLKDVTAQGGGHTTSGPLGTINAVALTCPPNDGLNYSCYNVRPGQTYPERNAAENYRLSNNAPFQGRAGIGEPNAVESHSTYKQRAGVASDQDLVWFVDGRPFFGQVATGSEQRPAVQVEDGLWKFTPDQLRRFRPKHMPTIATCGAVPLQDMSGPGSRIVGTTSDTATNAYRYCVAAKSGECREDSQAGEVFVSCAQISSPWCVYPGVATTGSEIRDICIMDNGTYNQGITQLQFTTPDLTGRNGRVLTYGLSQYRMNDPFWNARATPDGKWLMFRTLWVNSKRADVFLAKLPPFERVDDQPRNGYQMTEIQVKASDGVAGAMLEFGYNAAFECTSRKESCVAGAPADGDPDPFLYSKTDAWQPVACADGCTLRMPLILQRVVYYRIRYFNDAGVEIRQSATNVWGMQ